MQKTYRVEGMTCGGCAGAVERAIKAVCPQAVVVVNVANKQVQVEGVDDEQVIRTAVEDAGFSFGGAV